MHMYDVCTVYIVYIVHTYAKNNDHQYIRFVSCRTSFFPIACGELTGIKR